MNDRKRLVLLASAVATALLVPALGSAGPPSPSRKGEAADYPLRIVYFQTEPRRPKADSPFFAAIGVMNEETGEPPLSVELSCRAKVGRRSIRVQATHYSEGLAVCGWVVPRKTGGKRFYATIAVHTSDGSVARKFTKVIRRA